MERLMAPPTKNPVVIQNHFVGLGLRISSSVRVRVSIRECRRPSGVSDGNEPPLTLESTLGAMAHPPFASTHVILVSESPGCVAQCPHDFLPSARGPSADRPV